MHLAWKRRGNDKGACECARAVRGTRLHAGASAHLVSPKAGHASREAQAKLAQVNDVTGGQRLRKKERGWLHASVHAADGSVGARWAEEGAQARAHLGVGRKVPRRNAVLANLNVLRQTRRGSHEGAECCARREQQ